MTHIKPIQTRKPFAWVLEGPIRNPHPTGRKILVMIYCYIQEAIYMDMVTHAILGAIIAEIVLWKRPLEERIRGRWIGAIISAAPDFAAIPAHFVFSWSAGDWPWVYDPAHWDGVENSMWLLGYWFTHSLLISFVVYLWFRHKGWPIWIIVAWSSHGVIDILSHTGAWSTWPLFPFPGQIEGVADPWSWSPIWWLFSIIVALVTWYSVSLMTERWRNNTPVFQ